jgi:hypothetical protein
VHPASIVHERKDNWFEGSYSTSDLPKALVRPVIKPFVAP